MIFVARSLPRVLSDPSPMRYLSFGERDGLTVVGLAKASLWYGRKHESEDLETMRFDTHIEVGGPNVNKDEILGFEFQRANGLIVEGFA